MISSLKSVGQTSAHIPGHEHPVVVAIIPSQDSTLSSAAVVVDVLLTDPDGSHLVVGSPVDRNADTESEISILHDISNMLHPTIRALLDFVPRFKEVSHFSNLISIFFNSNDCIRSSTSKSVQVCSSEFVQYGRLHHTTPKPFLSTPLLRLPGSPIGSLCTH